MDEVPEAIDMAVRLMTPQEVSLVTAKARLAFQHRSDRPEVRAAFPGWCCPREAAYMCNDRRLAHATVSSSGSG